MEYNASIITGKVYVHKKGRKGIHMIWYLLGVINFFYDVL